MGAIGKLDGILLVNELPVVPFACRRFDLLQDELSNRHACLEFDAVRAAVVHFQAQCTAIAGENCGSRYMR